MRTHHQPSQSALDRWGICDAASLGGGESDFSHSFMKSEAVFFRLLGVRLFKTGGSISASLFADGVEGPEGVLWCRLPDGVFFLPGVSAGACGSDGMRGLTAK